MSRIAAYLLVSGLVVAACMPLDDPQPGGEAADEANVSEAASPEPMPSPGSDGPVPSSPAATESAARVALDAAEDATATAPDPSRAPRAPSMPAPALDLSTPPDLSDLRAIQRN